MFKGKTVVVTGASSGIGAAVAKKFAKEGAAVAICGRNQDRLSAVAEDCRKKEARDVMEVVIDLSKEIEVRKFADKVKERFSTIDVLVNNAASTVVTTFLQALPSSEGPGTVRFQLEYRVTLVRGVILYARFGLLSMVYQGPRLTSMEEYDRIFNVNVRAPFLLTQLLLPNLAKSLGCVVNMSSMTATTTLPKALAYGMSKAAINHFTEALSFECSRCGVRVNGVSPAAVKTRQLSGDTGENRLTLEETDATMMFMATLQPFGTLSGIISADDVANSVLFLASPSASNITGHTINIEAGYNPYHAMPML